MGKPWQPLPPPAAAPFSTADSPFISLHFYFSFPSISTSPFSARAQASYVSQPPIPPPPPLLSLFSIQTDLFSSAWPSDSSVIFRLNARRKKSIGSNAAAAAAPPPRSRKTNEAKYKNPKEIRKTTHMSLLQGNICSKKRNKKEWQLVHVFFCSSYRNNNNTILCTRTHNTAVTRSGVLMKEEGERRENKRVDERTTKIHRWPSM